MKTSQKPNITRILVAVNDLNTRSSLKQRLSKWGYKTDLAQDGIHALELYQANSHTVIICELKAPDPDGIDLIEKIRETPTKDKPYIIMVTPDPAKGNLIAGMEAGADDYIIKPIRSAELHIRLDVTSRILLLENRLQEQEHDLEYANAQMKNDLLAAARIQQSFLPHAVPQFDQVRFEWGLLPCDELAGDALNVIQLDDTHVGFYLFDVSGHGVAAALLAMTLIHTLSADKPNSVLFENNDDSSFTFTSPAQVAGQLNSKFPMDDQTGQYFTIIYGVIDLTTKIVKYVTAGHPGPLLIPETGHPKSLPTTGMPIGFIPESNYGEESIQLSPKDRLYFFSDGIPETTNKYDEQFGYERMIRILHQQSQKSKLRESIDNLAVSALKWNGLAAMNDDVSILGVEIK